MPALSIPVDLDPAAPPKETTKALTALAAALDDVVPAKRPGNLLIGTWNVALLGGLTHDWVTPPGKSPKRNLTDICAMAEIISRFDVCALQEVKSDLTALRTLLHVLGEDWTFIVSDVTAGAPGNSERLAFVYDRRRVHASGLVGEVVLPADVKGVVQGALDRQFARTPYAVSFAADPHAFTLITLHTLYGTSKADKLRRRDELQAIAEWLADLADDADDFNRNLIALGDFNIDRRGDPLWEAFASTGLGAPAELQEVPRNISAASGGPSKYYDQIAWFTEGVNGEKLTLEFLAADGVRWTDFLMQGAAGDASRKAHVSDHYPLWVEFRR
jgi:endonuclease/exonuclease/phosphatase family metal-dependent hydrolase